MTELPAIDTFQYPSIDAKCIVKGELQNFKDVRLKILQGVIIILKKYSEEELLRFPVYSGSQLEVKRS
jgi:hypothetical protein